MEFEDEYADQNEAEHLEEMLGDLGISDSQAGYDISRRDTTVFVIDCRQQMLQPLEGEEHSEMQKILTGYANFMMAKVIAGNNDKVGLILFNVKNQRNDLKIDNIYVVNELHEPNAETTKNSKELFKNFEAITGGCTDDLVSVHSVLWVYNNYIADLPSSKYFLRMFLFTPDHCPHEVGDPRRDQAIHYAKQIASKDAQVELFPVRGGKKWEFDIRKFYQ